MWHAATAAINIEAEFALRIFCGEKNFARGSIESFGHYDEVMDEFLHLGEYARLRRSHILPIVHVDRTVGQFIDHLPQNFDALAHLFDSNQVTIITITGAANYDIEVVVFVV